MPKKALCCCPHHNTWGHADDQILQIATADSEINFCGVNKDGRHNGHKRKICMSCRDRINLEARCEDVYYRYDFFPPHIFKLT